jgi:DNA adenine methylase
MAQIEESPATYVDPFVGGGSVAIYVANHHPDTELVLNDIDPRVAAFWSVVSDDRYPEFRARIEALTPTVGTWTAAREERAYRTEIDLAVCGLFLNRCTFSGNMSLSSGGPIGGHDQSGKWKIDARWKLDLLLPNLDAVHGLLAGRVDSRCGDWKGVADIEGVHYYDPPYVDASVKALYYSGFDVDEHLYLRDHLRRLESPWVLSYEHGEKIDWLYQFAGSIEVPHSTRFQQSGPSARVERLFYRR